jgi:GT2 family glycosyltransferase
MSTPAIPNKIRVVCATRETAERFPTDTALGRSLSLRRFQGLETRLFASNSTGLSRVYNVAIEESRKDPAVLVFAHDDIYLTDFYWTREILGGIKSFDVVGVAGNKRRVPRQPSWLFVDEQFTPDDEANLSGIVGHGEGFPPANLSVFGPPMQRVVQLDGLILWSNSAVLHKASLRFDERFDFHFYDLDFCREAQKRGLILGTWPLSVVHRSAGNYSGAAWEDAFRVYQRKWGD